MFGFVVFLVALVWAVSARKSAKPVLMWGLAASIVAGLLAAVGVLPLMSPLTAAGLAAAFGSMVGLSKATRRPRPRRSGPDASFAATHAHENLAINNRDQVWVRTEDGLEVVLSRYEVRETAHLWHPDRGYKGRNRIELRTIRLDLPLVVAPFNRHPETIFGAPKNAAEAEEWHARLSAFLQRS
jgi:hypothetical protein